MSCSISGSSLNSEIQVPALTVLMSVTYLCLSGLHGKRCFPPVTPVKTNEQTRVHNDDHQTQGAPSQMILGPDDIFTLPKLL